MTAIVGPNGSGKSNIADALRWVLGEASTRLIRAKKMEDVIYAGSGSGSADLPLMEGRTNDGTIAYVCEAYACQEPTNDPERLRALLR